jgi:3-oxoacyl-[acyl-carrier protein] reductase
MDALHILITGASGGIGEATALRLAQPSTRYTVKTLVLHYNSNSSKTQRITEEIRKLNPDIRVAWLQADLGSADAVERLHRESVAAAGAPINVLFANAGTTGGRTYYACIYHPYNSQTIQPELSLSYTHTHTHTYI